MWARLDASNEVLEIIANPKPMTLNGTQKADGVIYAWPDVVDG